ncbi:MAG TPA: hypothetical protein VK034_25625 [Enhygromyxa sp.]|nr:hypothetical protein [Enhygromyxa sp.]
MSGAIMVAGLTTLVAMSLLFLSLFVSERDGVPRRRQKPESKPGRSDSGEL